MSFFVRTLIIFFLLLCGGITYAQETPTETEETDSLQITNSRVVRINPESEMVESSERVIENFVEDLGEKAAQERATQIDFVLEVFSELNGSAEGTLRDLVVSVDAFIEESIAMIRQEKPQSQYVLRRLVVPIRDDLLIEIEKRIEDFSLLENPELFSEEVDFLEERIELIKRTLESKGEVQLLLDIQKTSIVSSFERYGAVLTESNRRLSESSLLSVITDTDEDGLSDFSEEIISKTDRLRKSTVGTASTDRETLLLGQNAASLDLEDTLYVDLSGESQAYITMSQLQNVEQRKNINDEQGSIFLKGLSVPASIVYGYIFPENVVFVTKANNFGIWEYTLTRELVDGEYSLYLGHLESNGNPVTRSKSFTFIHEGSSTYLEGVPILSVTLIDSGGDKTLKDDLDALSSTSSESPFMNQGPLSDFIRESFLIIVSALTLLGLLISVVLVKSGLHRRSGTYYSAMSPDGPVVNEAKRGALYESLDTRSVQD